MSCCLIKRLLCCAVLLSLDAAIAFAQNAEAKAPPVIDVHVHAMDGNFPGLAPMCPNTSKFIASDPKEKEEPFGWVKEPCTPALYPSAPGEYMKDVLVEMERLKRHCSRLRRSQERAEVERCRTCADHPRHIL